MSIKPSDLLYTSFRSIAYKWTILVTLSACGGMFWAFSGVIREPAQLAGMAAGIATFVALYTVLDFRLARAGRSTDRVRLVIAVYIKMATQIFPAIELYAGMVATIVLDGAGWKIENQFGLTYVTTVIVALELSFLIALMLLTGAAFVRLRSNLFARDQAGPDQPS
ncbi:MAG: hypothetical protein AAF458_00185 [Pseudomonadota bacterium]